MTDKVALRCEGVSVRFRPYLDQRPTLKRSIGRFRHRSTELVEALKDVSFDVAQGEALGVIGSNGAGKTTLLQVLAETLVPDEGRVDFFGATSSLLALGVGFDLELSGRRNVYLGGLAAGMTTSHIDSVYDDIVAFAELGNAMDRSIKTYSSGMRSRLAFSLAMHQQPDIMLLDEVLSVGDEAFQQKSRRELETMIDRAGTIILVSHSLIQVREFCSRAIWLDKGEIRADGPVNEVIDAYRYWIDKGLALPPLEFRAPWNAQTRMMLVLRILNGEDPVILAQEVRLPAARLRRWVNVFKAAGKDALRDVDHDLRGDDVSSDDDLKADAVHDG